VAPQESIDLLVALDSATVEIHRTELSPRGIILIDNDLSTPEECCRKVPFKELAPERYANITALGVVGTLLGLREEIVVRPRRIFLAIKRGSRRKSPGLQAAFAWTKNSPSLFLPAAAP
jgi:Pyruvate/2-oxoacid:ferredoxin oxidoreductase gamma subunit